MIEKRKCKNCEEEKPLDADHFHFNLAVYKTEQGDLREYRLFRWVCKTCRQAKELERWNAKKEANNQKRRVGDREDWRACKQCKKRKPSNVAHWQVEKRKSSGFRQPCKACLKKRKGKPISLDQKTES